MNRAVAAPAVTVEESRSPRDSRLRDYLVGAFAFTWLLWVPAGLGARGALELPLPPTPLFVLGSFGPMLAAIAVAARHGGKTEVKQLLGRLRFRGVARRWFAYAFVLGAVTVVPALAYLVAGGETDPARVLGHLAVMPLHFVLVATIGGGLDEEVGWRGMAQPLLQRRLAPVPANLLLGVIWATWHLPLWLDPASAQAAYPFALYVVVIVGHALVTGYLYNATGGSLLIAVFVHSINNTFDGLNYAVLGDSRHDLTWKVVLAALSLTLGVALCLRTRGRLGLTPKTRSGDAGASPGDVHPWVGPASSTPGRTRKPVTEPKNRSRGGTGLHHHEGGTMSRSIVTHIVIDAPVDEVWDTLTDLGGHRSWNPFITNAAGAIAVGERLSVTIAPPGGRPMTFKPRVTLVEKHRHLEWLGRAGIPGIFDGRHTFSLSAMPGGRTLMRQTETFSGLLIPFTGSMLERTRSGFVAMNEALARHVEHKAVHETSD